MWRHPFLKGLTALVVLNMLVKPVWVLGIDRAVQNQLGHEVYGAYFALLNLSVALSFVSDAGLTNMMNQQLAKGERLRIGPLFGLKVLLSMVYLAIVFLIALLTGISNWNILIYVTAIQILASFLLFFRAVITANQQFQKDAWLSVFDKSLLIIVCAILIYGQTGIVMNIDMFLQLQVGSLLMAVVIAGFFAWKNNQQQPSSALGADLWKRSFPFFVLVLMMSLHNRIDAFLLERIHPNGAYEAGLYASAYRLLDAANMVGYLVGSFLVPFAARHLQEKKQLGAVTVALRNSLLAIAAVCLPLVFVFSKEILQLLYPALTAYPISILQWCITALPFYYLTHIYGSLLTAQVAIKTFSLIVSVSLALNILLNLVLIPLGAFGCAIAACCSQLLTAGACMYFVKEKMAMPLRFYSMVLYGILALVLGLLLYFGNEAGYHMLSLFLAAIIVAAFLMFVTIRTLRTAFNT